MKKKLGIIVLTLTAVAVTLVVGKSVSKEQIIFINEVRSWDCSSTRDGYYGSDYIELYNASDEEVSLNGWYISDDVQELKKYQLYDAMIGAHGFTLLYANGKQDSGASLNFKLNPAGEKIFLSDAQGNLVDSVYVPKQEFGTVYARVTDGSDEWCVKEESTDYSNNEAKILPVTKLEAPVFSHESGFYEEAFTLELEAGENETIYYTLDGSKPTKESAVYESGIYIENISNQPNVCNSVRKVVQDWLNYEPSDYPVDKAVIVRAVAMNDKNQVSEVATNTYFVDEEKYHEKNVLSIVADFDDLFGSEGIFVTGDEYDEAYLTGTLNENTKINFLRRGRRWEIQGNMQLIENGREKINQQVGIRTQGASTRLNPKKRMSIYSREEYSGNKYFDKLQFGERNTHSVVLNSAVSNVVFPALVKDRSISVQDALEIVVFLNGEYWYDSYALEKYNKYFLEETYGVSSDNVILLKNGEISEGPENSFDIYGELLGYISNTDLSLEENYLKLEQMADMQSYIDYISANVYLCNMDMSETKNYVLWRTVENDGSNFGDGRWRWMIYDVDCLEWIDKTFYGVDERAAVNSFDEMMQFTGVAVNEHLLFSAAKRSDLFRKQFVLSFLDMANVNFSLNNVEKIFAEWDYDIDEFGDFFQKRFEYIVPYMAEEFGLTGTLEEVTLKLSDIEGGSIQLNTTYPDVSDSGWTGKYYTDYPVTLTAIPADGYRFVGWNGSITSDNVTIEVEILPEGIELEAVFEKIKE